MGSLPNEQAAEENGAESQNEILCDPTAEPMSIDNIQKVQAQRNKGPLFLSKSTLEGTPEHSTVQIQGKGYDNIQKSKHARHLFRSSNYQSSL